MNNDVFSPLPVDSSNWITCHYRNTTSQLQVIRVANIQDWYFERVVFPGQQLLFRSSQDALLEVHTGEPTTAILADRIPCARIRCTEPVA